MNRFLEIAALSAGGLSLCLVGYAAFAKLTGHGEDDLRDFGRWLAGTRGPSRIERSVSPPAVSTVTTTSPVEASLGILSAWTLPSPYSSEELESLAHELTQGRAEVEELQRVAAQRAEAVERDEQALEERLRELEDLRVRLEALRDELTDRDLELAARERPADAAEWRALADVLAAIEDPSVAAGKLAEFGPAEAARILVAFEDPEQASLVLNAVAPEHWKEYVAAYSAERAAGASRRAP